MRSQGGENSDEFFREVDEAVRQDRWTAIWKQYGAYIMGAGIAVAVGATASVGWQTYQKNTRDAQSRSLAAATALMAQDRPADAASAFRALANDAGGGVGVVATFRAADAEKQAGNPDAKVDALASLASDGNVEALYRDLAKLLTLQEELDEGDADSLIAELNQAAAADSPWRASLLELRALAEIKAGQTNEARATLQDLLDAPDTPASLTRRAGELLDAIGGPLEEDNKTVSQNEQEQEEVSQE